MEKKSTYRISIITGIEKEQILGEYTSEDTWDAFKLLARDILLGRVSINTETELSTQIQEVIALALLTCIGVNITQVDSPE